jgi:RNA polymerase sigma-70 factor (ECF subfamily)
VFHEPKPVPDRPAPTPAVWVEEHGDVLYRYALMRVRNRDVAEELVQETFLSALRGWSDFAGQSAVQTWLISILRRKIVDHFRAAARSPASDEGEDVEGFSGEFFDHSGHWQPKVPKWYASHDQALHSAEFWGVLEDCITSLPEKLASVFCLREVEQVQSEELCKILGITASNLWARLHRARMYLRRCVENNWFSREE